MRRQPRVPLFWVGGLIITYFFGRVKARGGEVFRERPLKKLFGFMRSFSVYRAAAVEVRKKCKFVFDMYYHSKVHRLSSVSG